MELSNQRDNLEKIEKEERKRREKQENEQKKQREELEKEYDWKFNLLFEYFSKEEIKDRNPQNNEIKIIPLNEVPDNQKAEKKEENKNKKECIKKEEKGFDFQNLRKRNRNEGNVSQNLWIWLVLCLHIYNNYFIIWTRKNLLNFFNFKKKLN